MSSGRPSSGWTYKEVISLRCEYDAIVCGIWTTDGAWMSRSTSMLGFYTFNPAWVTCRKSCGFSVTLTYVHITTPQSRPLLLMLLTPPPHLGHGSKLQALILAPRTGLSSQTCHVSTAPNLYQHSGAVRHTRAADRKFDVRKPQERERK